MTEEEEFNEWDGGPLVTVTPHLRLHEKKNSTNHISAVGHHVGGSGCYVSGVA